MAKKITDILKTQAPPDFNEFFQKRAIKNQAIVNLLHETIPTSGSPEDLLEESNNTKLKNLLKKYQPYLAQLLIFDRDRLSATALNELLTEALQSTQQDELLLRLLQSLMYMDISLQDYIQYNPINKKSP
jgi:hypothetical protein